MTVLFISIIAFAIFYYLLGLYSVGTFARRKTVPAMATPPISVLKPVKGLDFEAFENFLSFLQQDYPTFEVLFGVESEDDAVIPVIERMTQAFPERDVRLIVTGPVNAMNRKVGLLAALAAQARYELLVISDSDVRVSPDYLTDIAAPFADPNTGMVTCLYRAMGRKNTPAALEALMIHVDFFPAVLIAERLEGLSFGLGATMAVRRSALTKIGGFHSLRDYLADDYLLGHRITGAGLRIILSAHVVTLMLGAPEVKEFLMHQLRWARTYKTCRPAGYFATILTQGVFLSLIYLIISGFSSLGWTLFFITASIRILTASVILRSYLKDPGWLVGVLLLPIKEILSVAIWGLAFLGNRVSWKDKSFALDNDGRMIQL